MNPFFSSRVSDCRGQDDIPQSIDTSKRYLDDRTLRNDTSYLIQTNAQNNLTQNNINQHQRTLQNNSHNGTFLFQNQNHGILEPGMVSFINGSFNQPNRKANLEEGEDEEPQQPDTPPQNERDRDYVEVDISVQHPRERDAADIQNQSNQIDNGDMNIRQELNPPFNFQQRFFNIEKDSEEEEEQEIQQYQQQQQAQRAGNQDNRNQEMVNSVSRQQRHQQQNQFRSMYQQRNQVSSSSQANQRSRIQQPLSSIRQFQSPQSIMNMQAQQQQLLPPSNVNINQRISNPSSRVNSSNGLNDRIRQSRSNVIQQQNNYLDGLNSYLQGMNIMSMNQQQLLQNQANSRASYNNTQLIRQYILQNQMRQQRRSNRENFSDMAVDAFQNDIENVEFQEQQRQVNQLNQIIQNSRRRMNENRRANRQNQVPVNGIRGQQVVELEEEDKLRSKLIFKKALTHLIILSVFSVFFLAILYINILMDGLWLILFFIFCFVTGNRLSFYKSLSDDTLYEEKRQAFFDVIECIFINVLLFMIFLFVKLINEPVTLLFVYTPFVHIIWWLVFTTKTSDGMNRHIELLLRIYAVTQTILFAVQFDRIVTWSWVSIFLPSWILLSSLGFYIFGLIVLFMCSLYYCLIGQTDKYQIKGLIWCLMVSVNVVGDTLFFLLSLMDYEETNNLTLLRYSAGAFIGGSIISSIYTIACAQDLEIFIALANSESLFSGVHQVQEIRRNQRNQQNLNNSNNNNEEDEENQDNQNEQNLQDGIIQNQAANFSLAANRAQEDLKPKKIKIIRTTKAIPRTIPQFLIRFSSTYFQQSDVNRELVVLLQKKNMDILKKKKGDKQEAQEQNNKQTQEQSGKKLSQGRVSVTASNKNGEDPKDASKKLEDDITLKQRESVKEEKQTNRSLQSSKLTSQPSCQQCLVCFDNTPDSVILECGHGGLCNSCALDIWKKTGECYLCRQTISKIVQIDVNQQLGKYKQIIAISNMHEVSHDQDQEKLQNRSESVVLQNNNNPIEQPFEEQLNEEIQHAGQHQHEPPQVIQQPIQSIAQPQQIQLIENQQSGLVMPQQVDQQVMLSQQEIQEHQQERQEQIIVQENDQSDQPQIQQIEAVEVEQSQIQEINTIQNNQQNVENTNQNENITIIEFDDSDEEKKEPDERQQYQESTVMKVTLSQYTNNQENQVHFSSMNISDFDTIKHNLQIETNNNKMSLTKNSIQPNSQQTLSNEQLEFQMQQIDEVNHEEKINTSISKYCSEPANTIKKPEMVHISPKNINQQQEVSVIQTFSNQSIGCDENQRNLSINNNSIFQQNAAYTVPASPNPKRIDFNSTNNFGNYKFSNSEPQNNIKLKINDNLYGVYSKSENKYNDNGKERRESNNLLNLQEWDIEDTQQSTNRSQHIQNLQATQDGCTLNKSNLIFNQTYQSQDTSKIQALDKYMSKYFDANIQEDQFSETIRESILFQESNRKLNQLNNPDSVQINIKRQQDEQVKYSKDNKENDITSFEDNLQQPPSIQRQGILQPIPNNANLSNQDELQMIKSIEVIAKPENTTVEQQYINNEGQLSSVRVNKDKELITFDESEDISEV